MLLREALCRQHAAAAQDPYNLLLLPHRALSCAATPQAYCTVKADWSDAPSCDEFWRRMEGAGYLWLDDCSSPLTVQQLVARLPRDASGTQGGGAASAALVGLQGGGLVYSQECI